MSELLKENQRLKLEKILLEHEIKKVFDVIHSEPELEELFFSVFEKHENIKRSVIF